MLIDIDSHVSFKLVLIVLNKNRKHSRSYWKPLAVDFLIHCQNYTVMTAG